MSQTTKKLEEFLLTAMSLLPKSIHRCRRYPTKFNSGRDIPRVVACCTNAPRPVPKLGQPRHPQAPAYGRPVQKYKRTQDWRAGVSIVIAPWRATDLGRVGGDVGDSGSPHAQGKHRPATGCHAPGRKPGSRPGPHLDQNVLAGYAAVASASILVSRVAFFPPPDGPVSGPPPYLAQTWHSKIGIRDECRK